VSIPGCDNSSWLLALQFALQLALLCSSIDLMTHSHLRCLNVGKLQDVLAKVIFDFPVHVFADGREVYGHILRRGVVASDLEYDILGLVVAYREVQKIDIVRVG
jgi:hypothetical protein